MLSRNENDIRFSVFIIGFTTMITQIVLLRHFLSVFSGNELIVGIILAVNGLGVWALVFALLSQNLVQVLIWNYYVPNKLNLLFSISTIKSIQSLILFGGGQTLISLFNTMALQIDKLLIGKLLGTDILGYYGRAFTIMELPHKHIGGTIDRVMFPAMSKIASLYL